MINPPKLRVNSALQVHVLMQYSRRRDVRRVVILIFFKNIARIILLHNTLPVHTACDGTVQSLSFRIENKQYDVHGEQVFSCPWYSSKKLLVVQFTNGAIS